MSLLSLLRFREMGGAPPEAYPLELSVQHMRTQALELSTRKEIASVHRAGVRALSCADRYLLAGDTEGLLAVYDSQHAPAEAGPGLQLVDSLARLPKAHKYAVSSVCWYPPDPGLFVSGGYDGRVRAWDANELEPVLDFDLQGRVYALDLSACAGTHGLIAVGAEEATVRLCDLRSGAHTHVLHGHSAPVWAVRWSPAREHVLASGSQDCRARVWDVRKAGALHELDKTRTAEARLRGSGGARARGGGGGGGGSGGVAYGCAGGERPAQRQRHSAHDGGVNGLLFSRDGLELLTFGKDDRLRLWDVGTGLNLNVHYEQPANHAPRLVQMAVADCGGGGGGQHSFAYVPCGRLVHEYEWASGKLRRRLRCHFERVNALAYSQACEELFSGSDDQTIGVWAPPSAGLCADAGAAGAARGEARAGGGGVELDEDAWSDQDDDAAPPPPRGWRGGSRQRRQRR